MARALLSQATALQARSWSQKLHSLNRACAKWPYLVSGCSASIFLLGADLAAQGLSHPGDPWDSRRTLSMVVWGLGWYGGPQQWAWIRLYPSLIGRGTPRQAMATAVLDTLCNMPFVYIPAFFLVTGSVKGQSFDDSLAQLKREWVTASFGMVGFWLPAQYINFRMVPVYLQTFYVSAALVLSSTWFSNLSNQDRSSERQHGAHGAALQHVKDAARASECASAVSVAMPASMLEAAVS